MCQNSIFSEQATLCFGRKPKKGKSLPAATEKSFTEEQLSNVSSLFHFIFISHILKKYESYYQCISVYDFYDISFWGQIQIQPEVEEEFSLCG